MTFKRIITSDCFVITGFKGNYLSIRIALGVKGYFGSELNVTLSFDVKLKSCTLKILIK